MTQRPKTHYNIYSRGPRTKPAFWSERAPQAARFFGSGRAFARAPKLLQYRVFTGFRVLGYIDGLVGAENICFCCSSRLSRIRYELILPILTSFGFIWTCVVSVFFGTFVPRHCTMGLNRGLLRAFKTIGFCCLRDLQDGVFLTYIRLWPLQFKPKIHSLRV